MKIHFIISLILFLSYSSESESLALDTPDTDIHFKTGKEIFDLEKQWLVKLGDDAQYKNTLYNDTEWQLVNFDINWMKHDQFKNREGIFWCRKKLLVDVKQDYALFIPFHYREVEIYFNEILIFKDNHYNSTSIPYKSGRTNYILITSSIIKRGVNVLAMRSGFLDYKGGFISSIQIGPADTIFQIFIFHLIWYFSLSAVSLFLAIYMLFLFYSRRNERFHLYFSGMSFFLSTWTLGYEGLIHWIFNSHLFFILITYLSPMFAMIFIFNFIHSFL